MADLSVAIQILQQKIFFLPRRIWHQAGTIVLRYYDLFFFPPSVEEQERQERNRSRQTPKERGEDSANLDFMLALSLQNEGQAPTLAEQDLWRVIYEADQSREGPSTLNDIRGVFVYSALASVSMSHSYKIASFSWDRICFFNFIYLLFSTLFLKNCQE